MSLLMSPHQAASQCLLGLNVWQSSMYNISLPSARLQVRIPFGTTSTCFFWRNTHFNNSRISSREAIILRAHLATVSKIWRDRYYAEHRCSTHLAIQKFLYWGNLYLVECRRQKPGVEEAGESEVVLSAGLTP